MAASTEIVFANHTADHLPGDVVSLSLEEANRLVEAGMARYATRTEVKKAEEAEEVPEDEKAAKKK
jgi:hypothetical protein